MVSKRFGYVWLLIMMGCLSKVPTCQATSKPRCEATEVCANKEYYLYPCTCRANTSCGAKPDSTMMYGGVQYDFCQPVKFRQCAENEVALVNKGISRQIVHCLCPPHLKVMEDSWGVSSDVRKYRCVPPKTCDVNETCKVRKKFFTGEDKFVTSLKGLCDCPEEFDCEETGEILKPKPYLQWEMEIWRCKSTR